MKPKSIKKNKPVPRKKVVVPFIQDPNVSNSRIILHDKEELLEYIRDNVLEVLKPGQEETYVIGFESMTEKQLMRLPDIDY